MELDFEEKDIIQTLDMFSEPLSLSWGDAFCMQGNIHLFYFHSFQPQCQWANFNLGKFFFLMLF